MEQIKDLMKNIINCVSAQATNIEKADTKELAEAMDMIKDLAEAEYYCAVTKAMENPENVYGEDWNENGPMRKGYTYSTSNIPRTGTHYGRRGFIDDGMRYDNMDYDHNNMYYTTDASMNNMNSRYDNARRSYTEHKDMSSLNKIFDVIEADMKELKPTMTTQDIQTAKQRLMNLSNMI